MDFFKTATSFIIRASSRFPYDLKDPVSLPGDSIWTLYDAVLRDNGHQCSVFSLDKKKYPQGKELADNAISKLKQIRHPHVLKFLNSYEDDNLIYLATEHVRPLLPSLSSYSTDLKVWGLWQITEAMDFLQTSGYIHGNLTCKCLFLDDADQWKLGSFEICSQDALEFQHNFEATDGFPLFNLNDFKQKGAPIEKAVDSFLLGCFIFELFNPNTRDNHSLRNNIPPTIFTPAKRLIAPPKSFYSVHDFYTAGIKQGGYFHSPSITSTGLLDTVEINDPKEQNTLLNLLHKSILVYPANFNRHRVLTSLLQLIPQYPTQSNVELLSTALTKCGDEELPSSFGSTILETLNKCTVPFKALLLLHMCRAVNQFPSDFFNHPFLTLLGSILQSNDAQTRIYGLAIIALTIPRIPKKLVSNYLLHTLASAQNSSDPETRMNTTLCLEQIAPFLEEDVKQRVLSTALTRSLRDTYVPARLTALKTIECFYETFTPQISVSKVLPQIIPLLLDGNTEIRHLAKRIVDKYLKLIGKYAEKTPETSQEAGNGSHFWSHIFKNSDPTSSSSSETETPVTDLITLLNQFSITMKVSVSSETDDSDLKTKETHSILHDEFDELDEFSDNDWQKEWSEETLEAKKTAVDDGMSEWGL
ncbi:SCY1 protein kinase Ppk3 [Schizosaccharomyces japonicus yFS275]|uniref:SCY1 protein kinase Ppk3 n=1 Tax=Schizosaccharomyces japonicus (strain yFS275 / FY16936) TaxID=402676 RepID=B6K7B4_SCHJY|nr:SCY1 protein kinase Ppk3 [Schizosaccharomyces japonicus yFS275]EEB09418.2 SCY1 protein kinase Ppk3 [Schizosaccharomyces japonicus yFS275]